MIALCAESSKTKNRSTANPAPFSPSVRHRPRAGRSPESGSPNKEPKKKTKKSPTEILKPKFYYGELFSVNHLSDSFGEWEIHEKKANSTGGVTFDLYLKQSGGSKRRINGTASFSHSLGASEDEIVELDHFSILETERFKGYGPAALRHILKLYKRSGCLVIEVPAPNTDGTRCYEKCGMDRNLGLDLRVVCAESNFEPTSWSVTKNQQRAH